jgi:hypothetical protein
LKGATVLLGIVTIWKALKEFAHNRRQREIDLAWRQSEAAKKIIDDWMDDDESHDFCKMIEYNKRKFINEQGDEFWTDTDTIRNAIISVDADYSDKIEVNKRSIRDRCDSFLYFTEMMSQGERNNLYRLQDLVFPLRYYLKRMADKELYEPLREYARTNKFSCQDKLFDRILNYPLSD